MSKVFHDAADQKQVLDLDNLWRRQAVPSALQNALLLAAAKAHEIIVHPPTGVRNMSEWAKQQACWNALKTSKVEYGDDFSNCLTLEETARSVMREARANKSLTDGINAQTEVVTLGSAFWSEVLEWGRGRKLLTPKDLQVIQSCVSIPRRLPTDAQSKHALDVWARMRDQGFSSKG